MGKSPGIFERIAITAKALVTKKVLKGLATSLLLKVGINPSGILVWFSAFEMNKLIKWGYPYFKAFMYKFDRGLRDKQNIKELQKNETNGATSDEKFEDEINFVNGNKPNSH